MNLKNFLSSMARGGVSEFAKSLGVSTSYLCQMASGAAPIPHERAVEIEGLSDGAVTRRDMFPEKWHRIWPELSIPEEKEAA